MSKASDGKRWAILPPPSPNSAKISGEFAVEQAFQRKDPVRRTVSGEILVPRPGEASAHSFVHELEPSDSERVTEMPASDEMFAPAELAEDVLRVDLGMETIPAPAPCDDELPAHED